MRGSAVAGALAACEAGEWEGIRQLREWNGGRLRITLERMLGDEAVAAQALETALDDIWRHAGAHRAMGVEAEDWLFGRLRQVAQSYRNGSQTPAHLRPVPNVAGQAATDALSPTPSPPEASHLTGPDPGSPDLVNSRIRRPSAPVQSHPVARRVEATAEYRGGRGWLRAFLLWLLAGTVGLGLTAVGLLWLTDASPFTQAENSGFSDQPPAATTPPPAMSEEVGERPTPLARELIGPPLAAPEPSADVTSGAFPAASQQRAAQPEAQAPAPAPAASARIVIHLGDDADSREVAQRLADQLRRAGYGTVEIKVVPLEIGSASVRFFHAGDRLLAQQLVNALGPFLVWQGRAAPTTPVDFTDYRPLPSPGLVEIWLPRR